AGAHMVLMALLGGVRPLCGALLGAPVFGSPLEYFELVYGVTQVHLVVTGVLLGLVVLFMPDGVIPAVADMYARFFKPQAASIREVSTAELLAQRAAEAGAQPGGGDGGPGGEPGGTSVPTSAEAKR